VHQVLINEKYVGNNVWNHNSFKLKQTHVVNPPEEWIRANGAFRPIVNSILFKAAQSIIETRSYRMPDEEMLQVLKTIYQRSGYLSGLVIDEAEGCPTSACGRCTRYSFSKPRRKSPRSVERFRSTLALI
jgi:hypothetical protein